MLTSYTYILQTCLRKGLAVMMYYQPMDLR